MAANQVLKRFSRQIRKEDAFKIDPSHKDFYFEINGDAITEVLFKDEELAIDGKDLVMKYWNQEQPMRYEKQ